MSPCSYINDAATEDLQSILFIKRKTNSGGRHTVRQPKDLQGGSNREGVFAHSSAAIAAAGLKRKLDAIGSGDGGKGRCSPVEEHKGGHLEQQQELSSKRPLLTASTPAIQPALTLPVGGEALPPDGAPNSLLPATASLSNGGGSLYVGGGGPGQGLTSDQGAAAANVMTMIVQEPAASPSLYENFHFPSENALAALVSAAGGGQGGVGHHKGAPTVAGVSPQQQQQQQQVSLQQQQQQQLGINGMPCPATAAMNAVLMGASSSSGAPAYGGGGNGNPYDDPNLAAILTNNHFGAQTQAQAAVEMGAAMQQAAQRHHHQQHQHRLNFLGGFAGSSGPLFPDGVNISSLAAAGERMLMHLRPPLIRESGDNLICFSRAAITLLCWSGRTAQPGIVTGGSCHPPQWGRRGWGQI